SVIGPQPNHAPLFPVPTQQQTGRINISLFTVSLNPCAMQAQRLACNSVRNESHQRGAGMARRMFQGRMETQITISRWHEAAAPMKIAGSRAGERRARIPQVATVGGQGFMLLRRPSLDAGLEDSLLT